MSLGRRKKERQTGARTISQLIERDNDFDNQYTVNVNHEAIMSNIMLN